MTKGRVEANMDREKFTLDTFVVNTESGVKVTYKGAGYLFTVTIGAGGNSAEVSYTGKGVASSGGTEEPVTPPAEEPVTAPTEIGDAINSSDYGKKVVGYSAKSASGYTGDWRLFYQDTNYTYIITDTLVGSYKPSDYYSGYTSGADVSEVGQNLNGMLKDNGGFFVSTNTNSNIRTTAWLTDTDYWSDYTDDNGKAVFAIASPTAELFVKSFNATATANGASSITLGVGTYGYTENTTSGQLSTSYNNGIYNYSTSTYWWLASPSNDSGASNELRVDGYGGYFLSSSVTSYSYAVRPVVSFLTSEFQTSFTLE